MRWLNRISGYQFVLGWLAFMAAFALACEIWPELDRLATALSDPALYLGLTLAAGYLGWTAARQPLRGGPRQVRLLRDGLLPAHR